MYIDILSWWTQF